MAKRKSKAAAKKKAAEDRLKSVVDAHLDKLDLSDPDALREALRTTQHQQVRLHVQLDGVAARLREMMRLLESDPTASGEPPSRYLVWLAQQGLAVQGVIARQAKRAGVSKEEYLRICEQLGWEDVMKLPPQLKADLRAAGKLKQEPQLQRRRRRQQQRLRGVG